MKRTAAADHEDFTTAFATPHARHRVDGGTLAYWRFGRGPDVVAVHGWPLHSATFRRLLPFLTPHFSVHLFDLPGTGQTAWTGPVGFEEDAAALRAGIDAIGLGRYALLAHDSGGAIARLVARDNPAVSGLVLAGTEIPGHRPALLQAYLWAARWPAFARLVVEALQFGAVRRSPVAFGSCFQNAALADGDFAELFVRPLTDARVADGQMALLRAFRHEIIDALEGVHARIRAPALCIWGDRDPFFPVAKARAMLGQFGGGARLVEIPQAKLFVHEERPREFAEHAVPFLADCVTAPASVHAQ